MSDDGGARKRASGRQLTDRDDVDEGVAEHDTGVFQHADAATLAGRKFLKRGARSAPEQPAPGAINWNFPPAPVPATGAPAPAPASKEETPKKEATPTKETPKEESKKEGTPVKEAKEGTPTKETAASPSNGEKAATSTNPFPTSFSFGSFPTTSQPFSSTFPSFPSFSFTQPSQNTSGASIFGQNIAPPKPKEGSDDEGDDGESATIPEPEPTGAPTVLPQVAVVTGEEEEETLHSVRAKLYHMEGNAYKERGVGQLKLNRSQDGKVRLIMRDAGGKHLRLNVGVFAGMKFERAADNAIRFVAFEEKANTIFLLKVARKDEATELLSAIDQHKPKAAAKTTPSSTPEKEKPAEKSEEKSEEKSAEKPASPTKPSST